MLPEDAEWKKWSTLDRVTYFAQLAVVATLFATSYLSYATWQEAKEARRIQQAMFSAQNGPTIQIAHVSVQENFKGRRTLVLTFSNAGGSVSLGTCATVSIPGGPTLHDYCANTSSLVKSLRPSQSFFYSLPLDGETARILGFTPTSAAIRIVGEEVVDCRIKGDSARLRMLNVAMSLRTFSTRRGLRMPKWQCATGLS